MPLDIKKSPKDSKGGKDADFMYQITLPNYKEKCTYEELMTNSPEAEAQTESEKYFTSLANLYGEKITPEPSGATCLKSTSMLFLFMLTLYLSY